MTRSRIFPAALLGLALTMQSPLQAAPPPGYYLVWSDEFNSTALDSSKWDYWLTGPRRNAVNVTNAVSLDGSHLVITTYTSNNIDYTGMIASDGKFRSRYGYWEASIEWGDTNGMWSAFWMQSPTMGAYLDDPAVAGSEIDVCEHRKVDGSTNNISNQVQNNIHWDGYGAAAQSAGSGNIGSGLASGFHTYGFLWTPSAYTVFVDGANLRSWSYANNGVPVSESTEWAILSSEVDDTSTTWAGYIPPGGYGALGQSRTRLMVDYVRYYAPTGMIFWTGAGSIYLTNRANWISGMAPLPASDLVFSSLSGNNLGVAPGGNLAVDGLVFLNMNNGVSLTGNNLVTLGGGGIDMLAANHTVSLNCPVSLGAAQLWRVGPNNPGNTLNANGPVSGVATLTKAGRGTLILAGTNSFSGALDVDTGSTTSSDGAVRVMRSAAIAHAASISIRNNNGGSSTLQMDGSAGAISVSQNIALNGRNTNVAAIENLAGTNTLAGGVTINVGGGYYLFQSDAGTLKLGGSLSSAAGGTRTVTLQGNGGFELSGSMQNGSATAINLVKTNAGALMISGAGTFTGATTNWRGDLVVNGSLSSSVTMAGGRLEGGGSIGGSVLVQPGVVLSPGNSIGRLSIGGNLVLASGSSSLIELNALVHTNDSVRVAGTLTAGGSLIVTNVAGNLTAGDSFRLFNATSYGGGFSSVRLPPLGVGLAWDTNALASGTVSVVATGSPQIQSVLPRSDGNFILSGVAAAWQGCELDAATNLAAPIPWLFVTSAIADSGGNFQLVDLEATNYAQRFYRVLGR